jgi:hypothetical protein
VGRERADRWLAENFEHLGQRSTLDLKGVTARLLTTAAGCGRPIYLGDYWFSDVLASLSIGLAWVALLGIA